MPSSRHARMTRTAISPRLAMRSLRNMPMGSANCVYQVYHVFQVSRVTRMNFDWRVFFPDHTITPVGLVDLGDPEVPARPGRRRLRLGSGGVHEHQKRAA